MLLLMSAKFLILVNAGKSFLRLQLFSKYFTCVCWLYLYIQLYTHTATATYKRITHWLFVQMAGILYYLMAFCHSVPGCAMNLNRVLAPPNILLYMYENRSTQFRFDKQQWFWSRTVVHFTSRNGQKWHLSSIFTYHLPHNIIQLWSSVCK